ncbi:MAG: hypothetical protein ACJAYU_005458 [Bradymonadia bacterium]|jgi:hypothetical protein
MVLPCSPAKQDRTTREQMRDHRRAILLACSKGYPIADGRTIEFVVHITEAADEERVCMTLFKLHAHAVLVLDADPSGARVGT